MTEKTNRNAVRGATAAGGWTIIWGDLINEFDVITFAISIPTGSVGGWLSQQVDAQVSKFSQSLSSVSPEVVAQATEFLKRLMKGTNAGEQDFNGLGVKGGIATYKRWLELPFGGGKVRLPNNHQPYIGVRVTRPLPGRNAVILPAPIAPPSSRLPFDSNTWYTLKTAAKPGMALDIVNDGNQDRDGTLQMAAQGNFSGQHWQIRPSKTTPGAYNLCTLWLGTDMCLDVYGDDKTRPHLAEAGHYSGQQWHLENKGGGTWMLTNEYSGPLLVLAAGLTGSRLEMRDVGVGSGSLWMVQAIRPITESGFGL